MTAILLGRRFAAAGAVDGRPPSPRTRSIRCTGRASPTGASCTCATGVDAMRDEITRVCRRARGGRASCASARGCAELYRRGDAALHRSQLRLAARPAARRSAGARLVRLGAFRRLASKVGSVLRRRAPAAGVLVPVAVRRAVAVRGAGRVLRDHLHGQRRRRLLPGGRHPRGRRSASRPRRSEAGCQSVQYGTAVDRILRAGRTVACRGRPARAGDADRRRRRRRERRPRRRPTASLLGIEPPRVVRTGAYSPSCARLARRCARVAARAAPRTTTSTSDASGDRRSTRCCATACGCPTRRSS